MKIAQIMTEGEIKHAEEESLMQESSHPSASVSSVTFETFTPEPQDSLQTFFSSFSNDSFDH